MNAGILSSMAGLLVREVWGSLGHRMKQRMHKARPVAAQAVLWRHGKCCAAAHYKGAWDPGAHALSMRARLCVSEYGAGARWTSFLGSACLRACPRRCTGLSSDASSAAQVIRVVDCYSEPLLFVEASATRPWQILHANDPALRITGLDKASIPGQPFWQIFAMRDSKGTAQSLSELYARAGAGTEFTVQGLQCAQQASGSVSSSAAIFYTLTFRCGAHAALAALGEGVLDASPPATQAPLFSEGCMSQLASWMHAAASCQQASDLTPLALPRTLVLRDVCMSGFKQSAHRIIKQ